jgi:hypothetical protein
MTEGILIAPCGMNCSVCSAYLRVKNRCPGCRIKTPDKAVSIQRCKILNCDVHQKNKEASCGECSQFPCMHLRNLDKRYRTKYHMSMIENLENIKNKGMKEFLRNENERFTCPECGGTVCVHKGYCFSCKSPRQLTTLTRKE